MLIKSLLRIKEEIMERPYEKLIRYTKFETVSKEGTEVSPSTPSQTVFAKALAKELDIPVVAAASNSFCA